MATPPSGNSPGAASGGPNTKPDPMAKGTDLYNYIGKLSMDLQNGLISLEDANELNARARELAGGRGQFGSDVRQALRYGDRRITPPTDPVTDPTDPVTDPTDPPADPPGPPDLDAGTVNARKSAREYLDGLFKQFGFSDADRAKLLGEVDGWITEGLADAGTDAILMKFRGTTIYQNRFKGMAELISRGQAISEAEYIQLESSYRNTMMNYGLKPEYYDSPDDYARLIGAGLSPKEVEERVVAAKQAMNPLVAAELKQYYSIEDGDLTAYMLGLTDEKGLQLASARNQEAIRTGARAAQIGAAAERAGFDMDRTFAERLGGTSLGQNFDPFQMGTLSRLEGTFDQARRIADRETTLAGIDQEAFDQRDALSAAFGDQQKALASERRAKRERARFSGSSGVAGASLGVERNI